jgi:hypothetical protein
VLSSDEDTSDDDDDDEMEKKEKEEEDEEEKEEVNVVMKFQVKCLGGKKLVQISWREEWEEDVEELRRGDMLGRRPRSVDPPPPPPRGRTSPPSPSKQKRPGSQQSSMMNRLRTSEKIN